MNTNLNLINAQRNKNDEFFTPIDCVKNELIKFKHRLFGKRIICPCDGPESAFVRFLNSVKEDWGIKSVDYSYYNVETGEGMSMFDIDYSNYDICITNPPFSLYSRIIEEICSKIDFILLAPNNIVYRSKFFKMFWNKKCWLNDEREIAPIWTNTNKKVKCFWITSFNDCDNPIRKTNWIKFNELENKIFDKRITFSDGTNPLIVSVKTGIPEDYDGWMETTASFFNFFKLNDWIWFPTNAYAQLKKSGLFANNNIKFSDIVLNQETGKNQFVRIYFKKIKKD